VLGSLIALLAHLHLSTIAATRLYKIAQLA
jgi:hypothetical protein